jgi:hypothetical protein
MPACGAFRFGMVHVIGARKTLIQIDIRAMRQAENRNF